MDVDHKTSRKKRRRRHGTRAKIGTAIVVLLAVALGLLFARPSARLLPDGGRASTATAVQPGGPIRLVVPYDTQHAGEIVAAKARLFERAGLSVQLEPRPSGYDPIDAVVNGRDLFGVTDGASFLIARARGAPIVAFGAGYLESPVVFFSLDTVRIRTPQDFVGRKIPRQAGQDTAMIYDVLLQNVGLSRSQVLEVAGERGIDALLSREVDVLPGHVAGLSYELRARGTEFDVLRPADYGIHVPGTVYFTTEKTARNRPSTVQRFLNAVIAGWRMTYADEAASVPFIRAAIGDSAGEERVRYELAAQRDFVMPSARRIAEFDELQWKQLRIVLLIERMIEERADLAGAVDYSFLKEAYRRPLAAGN